MSDSGKPQIWDVPVTSEQRVQLFQMAFDQQRADKLEINEKSSKPYRRMLRAFGLLAIREAAQKNSGGLNPKAVNSDPVLMKVTAENVDFVLDHLAKMSRPGVVDVIVGELFDVLEQAKKDGADPAWASLPAFDPAAEDWAPPKAPEKDAEEDGPLTCPSCKQAFTLAEAKAA